MEILEVTPQSLAAEAGLAPGTRVVAVNGRAVRDFLDLHLWLGEEVLDLTLERPGVNGGPFEICIVREYGRELGLTFQEPRIRVCGNDCPFCFVDQLPPGLRKNLYIRDDDYRFSYLYGHFVTLTNLKEHEFQRIIDEQLSPLYVSVHALDPKVRERILVSKRAGEIKKRLEQLLAGGITLHTQVVLVPGVNDGAVLEETVKGLAAYYPGVRSVSVVPVGLTAHRAGLPDVASFDRRTAREVVTTVRRWGRAWKRRLGDTFCFVADEFVILAGKPIPAASYYGAFEQRENGIGLVRSFLLFVEAARPNARSLKDRGISRVLILTGESFGPSLQDVLPRIARKLDGIRLEVVIVENRLFGHPVTCGGLLGGKDLLEAARPLATDGDLVLVPDEAVSANVVFMDDLRPGDLARELGVPVEASWSALFAGEEAPTDGGGHLGAELDAGIEVEA